MPARYTKCVKFVHSIILENRCPQQNPGKSLQASLGTSHYQQALLRYRNWTLSRMLFHKVTNMHRVWFVCSHWGEDFPCCQATTVTVLRPFWRRLSQFGESHENSIVIRELILWEIIQNVCKVCPIYQYVHGAYHPQSIGFVEWTDNIIKTHQIKLCKAFSVPWPKALLLVLLNLVLVPPENRNYPFWDCYRASLVATWWITPTGAC